MSLRTQWNIVAERLTPNTKGERAVFSFSPLSDPIISLAMVVSIILISWEVLHVMHVIVQLWH